MAQRSNRGRRQAPPPPKNSNTQQYVMVFGLVGLLVLVAVMALSGGEKPAPAKDPANKAVAATTKKVEPKKVEAPANVPQNLIDRVEAAWPDVEKKGDEFIVHFKAAKKAQNEGNRELFQAEIKKARDIYNDFNEQWAGVVYAAQDMTQAVQDSFSRYLSRYESKVKRWTKYAKPLKELSTLD